MQFSYRVFLSVLLGFCLILPVQAAGLEHLQGRLLIQVEANGEAFYYYPKDGRRHFLGRPADAFAVMRDLGKGVTNRDIQKIPVADANFLSGPDVDGDGLSNQIEDALGTESNNADTDEDTFDDKTELLAGYSPFRPNEKQPIDEAFARAQAGYILLQVEQNGEAWYVNPLDYKRYFLGRPADAFQVMRSLGMGISNADLAKIPAVGEAVAPKPDENGNQDSNNQNPDANNEDNVNDEQANFGAGVDALEWYEHPEHGRILVDVFKNAVYTKVDDKCKVDCQRIWPPVLYRDGQGLPKEGSKFGIIQNSVDTQQYTYGGKPLFYYIGDTKENDTNGHGIGDEWFLVSDPNAVDVPTPIVKVDPFTWYMHPILGEILATAEGMSLYTKDTNNSCTGDCAFVWPPYLVAENHKPPMDGRIDSAISESVAFTQQYRYNGKYLNTYVLDHNPGDVRGDGIIDPDGSIWNLIFK